MVGQVFAKPALPGGVNLRDRHSNGIDAIGRRLHARNDAQVGAKHVRIGAILLAYQHIAVCLELAQRLFELRGVGVYQSGKLRHEPRSAIERLQ